MDINAQHGLKYYLFYISGFFLTLRFPNLDISH